MANIGSLTLGMSVESAAFIQKLDRNTRAVSDSARQMQRQQQLVERGFTGINRAVGILKTGLGALGIGIGIAGLVRIGRASLDSADQLAKMSRQLGLSVEQLQELRHGAELTGLGTAALDKNLERFTKRLGEAAAGTGELRKVVERHNIELRNAQGQFRGVNDLLGDFAELISRTESPQERGALAAAAFGREGLRMIQLLEGGRAAIEKFGEESRRLGQFTQEQAEAAEAANDEWERMTRVIGTSVAQAFLAATPQIEGFAFVMKELAVDARNFFEEMNARGAQALNFRIAGTNEQFAALHKQLRELQTDTSFDILGTRGLEIRGLEGQIELLRDQREELIKQRDSLEGVATGQTNLEETIKPTTSALADQITATSDLAKAQQRLISTFTHDVEADRKLRALQAQHNMQERLIEQTKEQERLAADFARQQQRQAQETERLLRRPFETFLDSAQSATANAFETILEGGVTSFKDLFDEGLALARRFASEMAALLVFRPQLVGALGAATGVTSSLAQSLATPAAAAVPQIAGFREGLLGGPAAIAPRGFPLTLGQTLGFGAAGAAGGGLVGGFFGGQGALGGAVGGGLGAIAGGALAGTAILPGIGTGVGALIGGLLGSLGGGFLGGLFGDGDSPGSTNDKFTARIRSIASGIGPFGGVSLPIAERGPREELRKAIGQFDTTVAQFLTTRQEEQIARRLQALGTFRAGRFLESDPAAALGPILRQRAGAILGGAGLNASRILAGTSSAEEIAERTTEALQLQRTIRELSGETTRFDLELKDLQEQFDSAIAKARDFGLVTRDLIRAQADAVRALERRQQAELDALALSVIDPFERLADPLRAFGQQLEFSLLNPADQAARAAADFRRIANEAAAGSTIAIEQLTGAGQLFIEQAGRFGASPGQVAAIQEVQSVLTGALDRIEAARQQAERGLEDVIDRANQRQIDKLEEVVAGLDEVREEIKRLRR